MSSGASTGETTTSDSHSTGDVSLNELSVTHNNSLFAGTVAGACVDALANVEFGSLPSDAELQTEPMRNTTTSKEQAAQAQREAKKTFGKSVKPIKEDRQLLLANTNTNDEYAQVLDESANLWSKAMNTLAAKGGNSGTPNTSKMTSSSDDDLSPQKSLNNSSSINHNTPSSKKAFDMSHILLLDESIDGGQAPPVVVTPENHNHSKNKRHQMVTPSSDYSIEGEDALVWGDDPEKAYFAYMLEQEAEHRAMEGKDQDDSLLGESTRQELLHRPRNATSSFDDDDQDDTTFGHGSKVFGWDPSTVAGGVGGNTTTDGTKEGISTLTPSGFAQFPIPAEGRRDKQGRLIIPNIIYVQDGSNPDPQVQSRHWSGGESDNKPEQARRSYNKRSKKQPKGHKQLNNDSDDDVRQSEEPKSGWYTNRILIGFALFFLVLTTGLVAALIIYRNHYAKVNDATANMDSSSSANLDESGNPIVPTDDDLGLPLLPPSLAPIYPLPTTTTAEEDDDDMDESTQDPILVLSPTIVPTWNPTNAPTWEPTSIPTWEPTGVPTWAPSVENTTMPTETSSLEPTEVPITARPTREPTTFPTEVVPVGTPSGHNASAPGKDVTSDVVGENGDSDGGNADNATDTNAITNGDDNEEEDSPIGVFDDDDDLDSVANSTTNATTANDTNEEEEEVSEETLEPTEAPSAAPTITSTMAPTTDAPTTFTEAPIAGVSPPVAAPVEATSMPSDSPSTVPTSEPIPTLEPTTRPSTQEPTESPTSSEPTSPPSTEEPTASPTLTVPTTTAPSSEAPVPPYASLETVRAFILEYSPMSTEDLFDLDSTQFIALEWMASWMASIPPRELGSITKKRLVQRWVMAVIYMTMNGPNWRNGADDWMGDDDACDWISKNNQGNCDSEDLVEVLDLGTNLLTGTIPKEITLLTSLTRLEMDRNDIVGKIPTSIDKLTDLVTLDFTRCDLTGAIPRQLGDLTNLAILGLGRNDFTSTIPTRLGNLKNLVYLGLERNDIRGTIPTELASLVELEYLALDWNELTGDVPASLRNLSRLRTLILARNHLTGEVPDEICSRSMDFVAADCEEVDCPCCDLCCREGRGCAST